jgi:hypothetical protein
MDNIFLPGENQDLNDENYINENDIIHRRPNLSDCDDNRKGIYDIQKLIYKNINRENILLSSNDLSYSEGDITYDSNKLKFDFSINKSGGIQYKKNVIGFRLTECIFTSPVFNITDNNNKINTSNTTDDILIPNGYYTIDSLMTSISASASKFSASYSCSTCKVTFTHITDTIIFKSLDNNQLLYDLGFRYDGEKTLSSSTLVAETHPSLNTGTYMDIVVDEIPYGACKNNSNGLNIIHRIPIINNTTAQTLGPVIHYKIDNFNNDNQYLFPPMNLSHLTIYLYLDGKKLLIENSTISFEFELVILNK